MREFYIYDDPPCNIAPPELDLTEQCPVHVCHSNIGDDTHKTKAYFCTVDDKQFAAKVREISNWEDLSAAIGERFGLFQIHVKSNSDSLLVERINDVIKFCNRKRYDDRKLYYVIIITYRTHEYFVSSLRSTPMDTYNFFRELIFCHIDEEPPFSYEIFSPEEASELLLDFCKSYLRNLPLIRHFCLPSFALRINTMAAAKENNLEDKPNATEADNSTARISGKDSSKNTVGSGSAK
ncbi:uncharacterized protein LOC124155076 isoform X2 [Ischnura elegans]|nr:uncharacterized protein LOC124155076 isoform X2 [Ischnura elegans]XP_046384775.1 uncharacterized protein LOC124155076 isoform X2 [Ischnura elegans]